MSYLVQSQLAAEDGPLFQRIIACAFTQGIELPARWVYENAWEFSARPGWADAYATAQAAHATDPENAPLPGADESAITDEMILDAVQTLNQRPAE